MAAPGLNLNKNQGSLFLGYNIDLSQPGSIIPGNNPITMSGKIPTGKCFSLLTEGNLANIFYFPEHSRTGLKLCL